MDEQTDRSALALAMYSSMAATMAVTALRKAEILQNGDVTYLVDFLTQTRQIAGKEPTLIEHAELLTDMLQASTRFPPKQG